MKVLLTDLDGTLIETQSGKTFPVNCMDMKLKDGIVEAIKSYSPGIVYIVTNQGGIEKGFVPLRAFEAKLNLVKEVLADMLGIEVRGAYCATNDPDNIMKKPNPGMLVGALKDIESTNPEFINEVLMVGDMDSDRMAAENALKFGYTVLYEDVKDFLKRIQ